MLEEQQQKAKNYNGLKLIVPKITYPEANKMQIEYKPDDNDNNGNDKQLIVIQDDDNNNKGNKDKLK